MSKEKKTGFNLQSILDTHENPFVIIDENYTIIEANRAYCACYDASMSDIVGSKCHMIHHNSDLPCHSYGEECPMQRVMETGRRYNVSHVHHNLEQHLERVIVKGFLVTDKGGKRYLGEEIVQAAAKPDAAEIKSRQSIEAEYIAQLLVKHNGHRRTVARLLKVSERTLYRKLVNYNLADVGKST